MWHHIQKSSLNKLGADTIHSVSVKKYQNYPSILMIKNVNILDEVIKLHDVHLYQITTHKKFTALKSTYAQ